MIAVDSHCHAGLDRFEPIEVVLFQMSHAGVEKAVLIPNTGNPDNSYLLHCLKSHPGKFAGTMAIAKDDDGTQIRDWAARGFRGLRLKLDARTSGGEPFCQWRTAAELGLVISAHCNISILLSPIFHEIVERFPTLPIALEHMAGGTVLQKPTLEGYREVMRLSRFKNIYVKVPGFGELCAFPYPFREIPPFIDLLLGAFGPDRLMWGSDFPLVCGREGYRHALEFARDYLSKRLDSAGLDAVFRANAERLWRF
jgi:predicted TIM-barrel fold metal-dependent hydrolase